MINVNPVPQQELERVKESLSATIDTLVGVIAAGAKAEVSGGTPSTLGGKAARAYVLRAKNETSYVRGCLFNGRIHIATTGGVGVTETHENATAFFDNFIPKRQDFARRFAAKSRMRMCVHPVTAGWDPSVDRVRLLVPAGRTLPGAGSVRKGSFDFW